MKKLFGGAVLLALALIAFSLVAYVAALVMAVTDAPVAVSPPFNTPLEDTAHYLTEEGEIVYVNH